MSHISKAKSTNTPVAARMAWRIELSARPEYWVLAYAAGLHLALFAYDWVHAETFLRADRANERLAVIQSFMSAWPNTAAVLELLRTNGVVGDYFFHLLVYVVGGQYGVIGFQVALMLYSTFALYRLVSMLTASPPLALVAMLIYLHLPHTLVLPHQLTTEAIFIPAIVISTYFTGRYLLDSRRFRHLALSGLLLGIASLVRPIAILWPIVVAGGCIVIARGHVPARHVVAFVGIALLPIGAWAAASYTLSGQLTLGASRHDLGHNLYGRVSRIAASLPEGEQIGRSYLAASEDRSLRLADYLHFVSEYPIGYLSQLMRDAGVFVFKSGIERVIIDYFEVPGEVRNTLQEEGEGWRSRLERTGPVGLLRWLIKEHPTILIPSAVGAAFFAALWLGAVYGIYRLVRQWRQLKRPARSMWVIVAIFPVYVFMVSQVVDAMQSRHRAPAEFVLCVLAAVALQPLWRDGPTSTRDRQWLTDAESKLGAG